MTCYCQGSLSEIFSCRRILSLMVILGFVTNAILKTVFNITIVAMIKHNETESHNLFEWNESQKQDILGVFFWGFAITKIPSGRLAETVGPRKVIGYSMILASLLTILTPIISSWSYHLLLASRVLMGFLIGASWPAVMPLAAKWIPPKEQSVFIACIASTALGVGITFHLCGFIIDAFGWASVFYITGGVALLWSLVWFYLIYDSPGEHPRISFREKRMIEIQVDTYVKRKKFKDIPWKDIVKSKPVWAIAAGQMAIFFGYSTLCNELPSYLHQVLHLNIKQNGIFSALPYWGGYITALISGYTADCLRKSGKLSTTAVRKLIETVALMIPSLCMVILALWGDQTPLALSAFTICLTTGAISTAGHCANILDISPNFSGTISGLVNTISSFSAYFSTQLVAELLRNGHTFQEWRYLFWILFAMYLCATIAYLSLCSGELQSWDLKKDRKMLEDREMRFFNDLILKI